MGYRFVAIQEWMIDVLKLQKTELAVFATIFGFSQDGETKFTGSINYIAKWATCTRQGAINCLKSLVEKKLLLREDYVASNMKLVKYWVNLSYLEEQFTLSFNQSNHFTPSKVNQSNKFTPCKMSLHNNISNTINNSILDKSNIQSLTILENNNKKNTKKSFGKITKQEQLKNDLILVINQFFIDSDILESLETHILSLFEISKLPSTISYKTSLNDLKKFKKEDILEMIKKSIKSNYNTFYPLNNKTGLARDGLPQLVETENDRIETEDKNKRKLAKYGIEV